MAAPAGLLAFLGTAPSTFFLGIFLVYFASALSLNMGATSLQLLTPAPLRGRLSGLYAFCTTMIGAGLGPLLVAALTQKLLHDASKVGTALAIVIPCSAVAGAAILWSTRHRYAQAIVLAPPHRAT
jgi:MFS family permease